MAVITNVTELQAMNDDLAGVYELGNDIDCGGAEVIIGYWSLVDPGYPTARTISGVTYYLWAFKGTLDGKEHTISNITINQSTWPGDRYVGFFRAIYPDGEVRNLNLSNIGVTAVNRYVGAIAGSTYGSLIENVHAVDVDVSADRYVGGFMGEIAGEPNPCTITNCSVSGIVSDIDGYAGGFMGTGFSSFLTDCHSNCIVTSGGDSGGFAGRIVGEETLVWERCSARGSVTTTDTAGLCGGFTSRFDEAELRKCFSLVTVSGNSWMRVGGFIGWFESGAVRDCYSRGNVENLGTGDTGGFMGQAESDHYPADVIERCYSTGLVVGDPTRDVGGFIGYIPSGNPPTITSCFWDMQASGMAIGVGDGPSTGITGKTTAEMKQITTFSAWDIRTNTTDLNNGYPFLSWQLSGSSPVWYIYEELVLPIHTDVEIVALEALRNIEMSAMGRIYVDEEGNLCYENRYARQL